jgi:hypothetical protein
MPRAIGSFVAKCHRVGNGVEGADAERTAGGVDDLAGGVGSNDAGAQSQASRTVVAGGGVEFDRGLGGRLGNSDPPPATAVRTEVVDEDAR